MNCPICDRELIPGPTISTHHLIPKLKGGKKGPTVELHEICHQKLHSLWTESELAKYYNTIEKILESPDIQNFVKWVKKKHPEFQESSKQARRKK